MKIWISNMDNFQIHIVKKNLYGNESHWIGLYGSFFFRDIATDSTNISLKPDETLRLCV